MHTPMSHFTKPANDQRGLSLVELMVSMLVSLILLAGVIQIFLATKSTYAADEALARMQENGRLGFSVLTRDIRQAGQDGCSNGVPNNGLLNLAAISAGDQVFYSPGLPVTGFDYTGTGPGQTLDLASTAFPNPDSDRGNWTGARGNDLPQALADRVLPGTDVLVVQGARAANGARPAPASAPVPPGNAGFPLDSESGIDQGRIAMVADCKTADLFKNTAADNITSINRGSGNMGNGPPYNVPPAQQWGNLQGWETDAQIFAYVSRAYFIGEDDGRPALRVMDFSRGVDTTPDTLATGIESMQVIYGVDSDLQPGADQYMTAAQINGTAGVVPQDILSVQLHLLTASLDPVRNQPDTETYELGATGNPSTTAVRIDPVDNRRSRQVFSTTVALRNRDLNN